MYGEIINISSIFGRKLILCDKNCINLLAFYHDCCSLIGYATTIL